MIDQRSDYEIQEAANRKLFEQLIKDSRPDIWTIMDSLDKTGVNWKVVWKVIYHLHNISTMTNYGKVVVEVENGVIRFVRGESADKLNESLLAPPDER